MLAWRDLDDVEAGGSEVHAAEIARAWADSGLEVTMRTSYAQGQRPMVTRDGYRVIRRAGRYLVFPRAALSEAFERYGRWDAIVEIWNGMPFLSPLWTRGRPHVVFMHHLHAEMWKMVLPDNPGLARAGELLERRVAPLLYRRTRIVTLSESAKRELVEMAGFRDERVSVVPPGIDPQFSPGPEGVDAKAPHPFVVAVGRLVPVKRYDYLIRAAAAARERVDNLTLTIVGEGYDRPLLEGLIAELGAQSWVRLAGRVADADLVAIYRKAWIVASASLREGWGMTLTEAAACSTPAVASRIAGHVDAVEHDVTGLLVDPYDPVEFANALVVALTDHDRRARLAKAAQKHAARFTWSRTAQYALEALAAEAHPARRA
jgi:glycosyltransferase involved in cell wall biosynthesis